MAEPRKVERPGISGAMLAEAGVRDVGAAEALALVGYELAGLAIPYRTHAGDALSFDGKPFYRLRVHNPTDGARYRSPAGGGCQLFIPPRLRVLLLPRCVLCLTEGEFKALALAAAGFPCVGIGGISSACPKNDAGEPEVLPALTALIAEVRPTKIAFIGDSDTALIPAFACAAVKLAKLTGVPVMLPRIPIDAPGKGPDDLRAIWGEEFPILWQAILDDAEPVTAATKPGALAVRLLKRESEAFTHLSADAVESARPRLIKLGAAFRGDTLAFEEIAVFAASQAGIGKQTFRTAVKEEVKLQAASAAAAHQEAVARRFEKQCTETPLYFDGHAYFRKELDQNYGQLSREDMRLELGVQGFCLLGIAGEPSPADRALHRLQKEARVSYAGPICGRQPGLIIENGQRILVTRGPTFLEGKADACPTITRLVANLFGRSARDPFAQRQAAVFCAWLKLGRIAMRNPREHRPGQVLALVGPKDCGKSLLQSAIITPSLGGRVADPSLFFTGGTTFNADLLAAEHLAIGDKGLGENGRERERLRDELKRVVAASEYPLHGKHQTALTIRPIFRASLSGNDDPESATSLPALDASFSDKIIYLRCFSPPEPFFNEDEPAARTRFINSIRAELPAFLAEVDAAAIPADLVKGRFGVREFHHPKILDLIQSSSPLVPLGDALESWIDTWDPPHLKPSVTMSSVEIYAALDKHLSSGLRQISSGPSHLGHQLARLAELDNWKNRIICTTRRVGGRVKNQQQTVWEIHREPVCA